MIKFINIVRHLNNIQLHLTKYSIYFFITFVFILESFPECGYAGAWVQKKHNWLTITRLGPYFASRFWDREGNLKSGPLYRKWDLSQYLEYGVTDQLTLGFNIFLTHIDTGFGNRVAGFGYNEFYARYSLYQKGFSAVSLQFAVSAPGDLEQFDIGDQTRGDSTELRLWGGTGGIFNPSQNLWFIDASIAYIQFYNGDPTRLYVDFSFGWKRQDNKIWLLLQSFNKISMSRRGFKEFADFDLYTIAPSLLIWFNKNKMAFQMGVEQAVYGRRTGLGTQPFIGFWVTNMDF